jgi:arylsulfatase A-like enzyme
MMTRVYPESLPTLPARRAIYTGQRVYPFANDASLGDFVGAPGGARPRGAAYPGGDAARGGYRTGLIADVYHMFSHPELAGLRPVDVSARAKQIRIALGRG